MRAVRALEALKDRLHARDPQDSRTRPNLKERKSKTSSKRSTRRPRRCAAAFPRGSVDWRIAFAEVFAARGGFDVVIANPPYVTHRIARITQHFDQGHSDSYTKLSWR